MKKKLWTKRITAVALAGLFAFNTISSFDAEKIVVPKTNACQNVLTDGLIEKEEWRDAKRIMISEKDSVYLHLMQTDQLIFLAIKAPFKMIPWMDIYLDYGENYVLNLHSSSQLGERILKDTSWTDQQPAIHFGYTDRWYANEQRFDRIKAQELLSADPGRDRNTMQWETTFPYDGFEYVLKKSRFNQPKWKVRIEVKTGMPGFKNVIYPADSKLTNSESWATFILN